LCHWLCVLCTRLCVLAHTALGGLPASWQGTTTNQTGRTCNAGPATNTCKSTSLGGREQGRRFLSAGQRCGLNPMKICVIVIDVQGKSKCFQAYQSPTWARTTIIAPVAAPLYGNESFGGLLRHSRTNCVRVAHQHNPHVLRAADCVSRCDPDEPLHRPPQPDCYNADTMQARFPPASNLLHFNPPPAVRVHAGICAPVFGACSRVVLPAESTPVKRLGTWCRLIWYPAPGAPRDVRASWSGRRRSPS